MESTVKCKFISNQAWEVVQRTPGLRVLKIKWVLKLSALDDGSVSKVKARLVACGYGQREGVDFTEVFASTLASTSFRILCVMIAAENLKTDTINWSRRSRRRTLMRRYSARCRPASGAPASSSS